jgi:hypothetical protein
MYIPIFKNRSTEMRFIKDYNNLFNSKIIPLIEIINDEYEKKFEIDPLTGKPKKRPTPCKSNPSKIRAAKIPLPPTDNDIITLDDIEKSLNGKMAFIDYFRYDKDEYSGINIDLANVQLAHQLSRDEDKYVNHIYDITPHRNLIPVISLKNKFEMDLILLEDLITNLQSKRSSIALRITYDVFGKYSTLLSSILRDSDYLLFDIREQNITAMKIEFMKLNKKPIRANKILLNSPRSYTLQNNQLEIHGISKLIDNSALTDHIKYNFVGFGDFAGLQDKLPDTRQGSGGYGSAYALLFQYKENVFYTYLNPNTKLGLLGYSSIYPLVLEDEPLLNPDKRCLAYLYIKQMPGYGSYTTWIYINILRYVSQIFLYY